LVKIDAERAALDGRRRSIAARGGDLALAVGSVLPIDTRMQARSEFLEVEREQEALDRRHAAAVAEARRQQRRDIATAEDAVRVRRAQARVAIERSWRNLCESVAELDAVDAPLRKAGASLPPRVNAPQLKVLLGRIIEDLLK
jgi:hypothetical protein